MKKHEENIWSKILIWGAIFVCEANVYGALCLMASEDEWKQPFAGFPPFSTNKQVHLTLSAGRFLFYLASVQPFSEFGEGGQSSESESDSPSAMYGRMVAQGVAAPPLWWSPRLVEDKQKLLLRKSRFSLDWEMEKPLKERSNSSWSTDGMETEASLSGFASSPAVPLDGFRTFSALSAPTRSPVLCRFALFPVCLSPAGGGGSRTNCPSPTGLGVFPWLRWDEAWACWWRWELIGCHEVEGGQVGAL